MTVGAQRQGATSTGGDAHSIAIEPQRPREGGRRIEYMRCFCRSTAGRPPAMALGSQEACARLMRGREPATSICARNDNSPCAHTHTHTHTHSLTHTHTHAHKHTHTQTHTHTHTPRAGRQAVERRARWSGSALAVKRQTLPCPPHDRFLHSE